MSRYYFTLICLFLNEISSLISAPHSRQKILHSSSTNSDFIISNYPLINLKISYRFGIVTNSSELHLGHLELFARFINIYHYLTYFMDKSKMLKTVKELPFDTKITVCKKDNTEVQLFRPSKLSARFKDYDVKKNFQIWLKEGEREFRPNHLRVMIDLNLRVRSRPELKEKLLLAFDNIFYGNDPEKQLEELEKEQYEHFSNLLSSKEIDSIKKEGFGNSLNSLTVIGVLAQLFIIEQEYVYHKESKFEPPTLFFQGWVREFIDNPKEIDNLCMSVCKGRPPLAKYVKLENKKDKKYVGNLVSLWYLKSNLK